MPELSMYWVYSLVTGLFSTNMTRYYVVQNILTIVSVSSFAKVLVNIRLYREWVMGLRESTTIQCDPVTGQFTLLWIKLEERNCVLFDAFYHYNAKFPQI